MEQEEGIEIEELLKNLRNEKNWNYNDVALNLKDTNIMPNDVKKWEYGLKYPDLDMMYKLSELYKIPIEKLVQAEDYSYGKMTKSMHIKIIKRINYFFDVSFKVSVVLMILFYLLALAGSFLYFMTKARSFTG